MRTVLPSGVKPLTALDKKIEQNPIDTPLSVEEHFQYLYLRAVRNAGSFPAERYFGSRHQGIHCGPRRSEPVHKEDQRRHSPPLPCPVLLMRPAEFCRSIDLCKAICRNRGLSCSLARCYPHHAVKRRSYIMAHPGKELGFRNIRRGWCIVFFCQKADLFPSDRIL